MRLPACRLFNWTGRYVNFLVFAALIASAKAQATDTNETEIVVTATRQPISILNTPATIDVVNTEKLRAAMPAVDISEFLSRVPGLNIQNRQNYAQDTQISARGFGARASFGIRGIKIFVDDIPVTVPDGQAQGALIPMAAVSRIEVLRGPWAVAYGNAAGGVIAASTRQGNTGSNTTSQMDARSVVGADDLRVNSLLWTIPSSANEIGSITSVSGLFGAQQFSTAGFRNHSKTRREHYYARLDVPLTTTANITFTANVVKQPDTQDPLGLTRAQLEQNSRQAGTNAESFNSRKSIAHRQFGGVWTNQFADLQAKVIVYGGGRNVTQFLTTPVAAQTAASSAGGLIDLDRNFNGVGGRLGQQSALLDWSVGVDVDEANDMRRGYENFIRDGNALRLGVAGNLRRNETNRQRGVDIYGQVSAAINPHWRLHIGARQSRLDFLVRDFYVRPGNGDDSGAAHYAAFSPAVGLVRVWQKDDVRSSIHINFARGFETPTAAEMAYRADQSSGLNLDLMASRNHQFEIGYRRWATDSSIRMTAFSIQSQNEIVQSVVAAGRSSFQNAAGTKRIGLEAAMTWRPYTTIEATLGWTFMRATVAKDYVAGAATGAGARQIAAGSWLPAVPSKNLFAEVAWRRNLVGWSAQMSVRARSKMSVDDVNSAFAAGYATLAASVNFLQVVQIGAQPLEFDTFVRVDNVFDHQYVGSVISNEANQRFYETAPGRRGLVGVNARWRF